MAGFTIDLAGRVRNFDLPKTQPLIPLYEAVVNSIYRAFDSFRKLEAFYREHQADLEIYDEYRRPYSWEEYMETVFTHSNYSPEPMKWVYEVNPLSLDKQLHLRTAGCSEEEAELYSLFNHVEYEKTLQKARQKFGVYEREYGDIKYWNDPDYLFDWTEGEFM